MSGAGTPEDDPFKTLQVDPAACDEVIDAAFRVLREMALRDESDAATARLVALMRAHRALRGGARSGG